MTFLHPEFLWALTLASLPVIIHLLNLRRYKTVYFSNTDLLENIEQEQKRRNRLRDIIILILRTLAIIMIILAFAMPLPRKEQSVPCSAQAIFYIDNSLSMTAGGKAGPNIETAKNTAFEILKTFPLESRFMILTNNLSPDEQVFTNQNNAIDKLANIKTSPSAHSINNILQKISNLIPSDTNCKTPVFILSDFQKNITKPGEIGFPSNANVYLVVLNPNTTGNISIDTAWFEAPNHMSFGQDSISVTITNRWQQDINDLSVKLYIDDTLKGASAIDLPANSSQNIKFVFFNGNPGWHKGKITIEDSPVVFDDTLFFAYNAREYLDILIIEGKDNDFYLQKFYSSQYFKTTVVSQNNIPYGDFGRYSCIILYSVDIASGGLAGTLDKYAAQGGTVVIFPSKDNTSEYLNNFTAIAGAGKFTNKDTSKVKFGKLDLNDPLFKNAVKNPGSPDVMPEVRLHWSKQINFGREKTIIEANDGTPLLTEAVTGKGKFYFFTFPLEKDITNFAENPLFAPVMFNIPALNGSTAPAYAITGANSTIQIPGQYGEYLKLQGAGQTIIPVVYTKAGRTILDLGYTTIPADVYTLKNADTLLGLIALNYDRKEAILDYYNAQNLKKSLDRRGIKNVRVVEGNPDKITASVKSEIDNNFLWKIFLILAVLFLILEMLIIRLIP